MEAGWYGLLHGQSHRLGRTAWIDAAFALRAYAAEAGKKKKARQLEPAVAPADPLAALCGSAAELAVVPLVAANLAFWLLWTAFVYDGGLLRSLREGHGLGTHLVAAALAAGLVAAIARDLMKRSAPPPPVSPSPL